MASSGGAGQPGEQQLRAALRTWRTRQAAARQLDGEQTDAPGCVFGVVVQNQLTEVQGDLEDVKRELQWVRNTIVAVVVTAGLATVLRFLGWTL